MPGLVIPTERPEVVLKEVTEVEDAAWLMAVRPFTHPLPPNQIGAPDYFNFRRLRQERSRSPADLVDTGIWAEDTMVGFVSLYPNDSETSSARVGYRVAAQYRRHGYATMALRAISDYAFAELGFQTLQALIRPKNTTSQGVAQRAGFEFQSAQNFHLVFNRMAPGAETSGQT